MQPLGSAPGKDDELLAQGRVLGLEALAGFEERGAVMDQRAHEADHQIASLPLIAGMAARITLSVGTTGGPRRTA